MGPKRAAARSTNTPSRAAMLLSPEGLRMRRGSGAVGVAAGGAASVPVSRRRQGALVCSHVGCSYSELMPATLWEEPFLVCLVYLDRVLQFSRPGANRRSPPPS